MRDLTSISRLPTIVGLFGVGLLVSSGFFRPAFAQELAGKVVGERGEPVEGALVTLLEEGGAEAARTITTEDGTFTLRARRAGTYRVRAERIGYRTWTSDPFRLEAGETLTRRFQIEVEPVELGGLTAEVETGCAAAPGELEGAARLWAEARKALRAVRWTEEAPRYEFELTEYRQLLDPKRLQPLRPAERRVRAERAGRPYGSLRPTELAEKGYIQRRGDTTAYYAPDAQALLSKTFRMTHCFGLDTREAGDERWVGLTFRPVKGREVPEVEGTLWLERETAELRRVDFEYWNLLDRVSTKDLGGHVHFTRLPSGLWIVDRWQLRFPVVEERRQAPSYMNIRGRRRQSVRTALVEVGGSVTGVYDADGRRVPLGDEAVVAGTVVDSTTGEPLPGAVVRVFGEKLSAVTDSAGRFRLTGVPPGERDLLFNHPRVELFRLHAEPLRLRLESQERVEVQLATPPADRVVGERICGEGQGAVAGWVRREATGEPVEAAAVEARWSETIVAGQDRRIQQLRRGRSTLTRPDGQYRLCLPAADEEGTLPGSLRLTVRRPGMETQTVRLVPEGQRLLQHDFGLRPGEGEARMAAGPERAAQETAGLCEEGPARVAGRVVHGETDVGLPGAPVRAVVTQAGKATARDTLRTTADGSGRFHFCELPGEGETHVKLLARLGEEVVTAPPAELPAGARLEQTLRVTGPRAAASGREARPSRGLLHGRVLDLETGAPIEGAALRLEPLGRQAMTDSAGRFRLEGLPPGEYDLAFRHIAYGSDTLAVDVPRGQNVELTLQVPERAIAMEPIEVEVKARDRYLEQQGFFNRMERSKPMNFLTPEEVDVRATSQVGQLLQTIPGVQLAGKGLPILRRTGCPPLIFLDGMRFYYLPARIARQLRNPDAGGAPTGPQEIEDITLGAGGGVGNPVADKYADQFESALRDLSGRNVLAVEVYEGPATTPGEFQGMETRCGVIAIWTKQGLDPDTNGGE